MTTRLDDLTRLLNLLRGFRERFAAATGEYSLGGLFAAEATLDGVVTSAHGAELAGDGSYAIYPPEQVLRVEVEGDPANDPPASPSADEIYLIGDAPTGRWEDYANQVATFALTNTRSRVTEGALSFPKAHGRKRR